MSPCPMLIPNLGAPARVLGPAASWCPSHGFQLMELILQGRSITVHGPRRCRARWHDMARHRPNRGLSPSMTQDFMDSDRQTTHLGPQMLVLRLYLNDLNNFDEGWKLKQEICMSKCGITSDFLIHTVDPTKSQKDFGTLFHRKLLRTKFFPNL